MIAPVGAMKLCLEPLDRHQTPHRIGQTAIAAIIASMTSLLLFKMNAISCTSQRVGLGGQQSRYLSGGGEYLAVNRLLCGFVFEWRLCCQVRFGSL